MGGVVGNYDVYEIVGISPVFAGMFFFPLFLIFSMFWFTFLTAIVLRKYDFCAHSVEQNIIRYKLEHKVKHHLSVLRCQAVICWLI